MRGRKSNGPRYFPTRKGWYTSIGGKPVLLAQGAEDDPRVRELAERKYHELKLQHVSLEQGDLAPCEAVFQVYLKSLTRPNTIRIFGWVFKKIDPKILVMRVCDLRAYHFTEWMNGKDWSPSTKRIVVGAIMAALNYAKQQGRISKNPVSLKSPKPGRRNQDCLITAEQHRKLIEISPPAVRDFLTALWETGARPGYIASVRASEYIPSRGILVLEPEPGRKLKSRVIIVLSPTLREMMDRLVKERPTGPLFLTTKGRQWTLCNVIQAFDSLRRQCKITAPITAYSYRHAYCTDFLLRGGSVALLAQIMSTSLKYIQEHYGHLEQDDALFRAVSHFGR